jgi:RNA polymerase sigma factor (sigma-70 family)
MSPRSPGSSSAGRQFATTQWSLVAAAGAADDAGSRAALEELCGRYWYPLYAFLRRGGASHADAQDLTQAFLLDLIEHRRLEVADRERGRFRSFLLASLRNFQANQFRAGQAQKRGGSVSHLSLDFGTAEANYAREPFHDLTPERLFERKWALQLLAGSLQRLEEEVTERGRGELFGLIKPQLSGEDSPLAQQEIADRLGMTLSAVKVAVHRWRERLGTMIREEIRSTVVSDDEVESELQHLGEVLGQ